MKYFRMVGKRFALYIADLHLLSISRGFTKLTRDEYLRYKGEGRIVPDGVNAKAIKIVPVTPCITFRLRICCMDHVSAEPRFWISVPQCFAAM